MAAEKKWPKVYGRRIGGVPDGEPDGFNLSVGRKPAIGGREERVEYVPAIDAEIHLCDGCEQKKPGCVSVGEEVLCADCLLARSADFGDEVKSLISSWREEAADPAVEPGRANALT